MNETIFLYIAMMVLVICGMLCLSAWLDDRDRYGR